MSKDPWKNRASGMRCRTCMFFVKKEKPKTADPAETSEIEAVDQRGAFGRCRRHAPTMMGYPAVFEMDWCGDHKLDENKL